MFKIMFSKVKARTLKLKGKINLDFLELVRNDYIENVY